LTRRTRRAATAAVLLALAGGGAAAEDPLLVIEQGGRAVFTNTPSRAEARPVPGFSRVTRPQPAHLPSTIYDPYIEQFAGENGVSPRLIKAVILVESALDPHAVSPRGAQGLMQLMPETARRYGVQDPFDPLQSIRAGTEHLRDLIAEFDGNVRLALAAYNAGAGAVRRAGGVPDFPETREYLRRIEERLGGRSGSAAVDGAAGRAIQTRRLADGTLLLSN
jgi:soluble lytic murein transglycosylase-like protein